MLSLNSTHVEHVKIYLACNFKVNLIPHLEVIALFSSNFKNVNTFHPLFQKLLEVDVKCKLKTCSACQDLHALIFQKLLEIKVKFKLQNCAAYQDLPTLQF